MRHGNVVPYWCIHCGIQLGEEDVFGFAANDPSHIGFHCCECYDRLDLYGPDGSVRPIGGWIRIVENHGSHKYNDGGGMPVEELRRMRNQAMVHIIQEDEAYLML